MPVSVLSAILSAVPSLVFYRLADDLLVHLIPKCKIVITQDESQPKKRMAGDHSLPANRQKIA
jgi:hypothetical protein